MTRMEEFMDFFGFKEDGYSISDISRLTGRDRKTIRKYLKAGKNKPPIGITRRKQSRLDRFEDIIKQKLHDGAERNVFVSAVVIYEYLAKLGYKGSVSLVRKKVQSLKADIAIRFKFLITDEPGKQAQVDWGEEKLFDENGNRIKVHIFCMTLSKSRTRFVAIFPKANRYYFLLGHIMAFEYFKGIPETILYDQTRCAIDRPGFKDVIWNRTFYDLANHYGFTPKACKPYRAQTKGKVERTVGYVKNNFLPMYVFKGFERINQDVSEWIFRVNSRIHSTTEKIPFQELEVERPFLKELPSTKYDLYILETRKVALTSTISFQGKHYSVPLEALGKRVTVKYRPEEDTFIVEYGYKLLCKHQINRNPGKYVILPEHQEEFTRQMRNQLSLVKPRRPLRKKYEVDDAVIGRSLMVYEEVGS
jgi:transposase